ncbi:hypothetical protein FA09DRAFT_218821 [Tilletiopsis washingtonensis]|uniref:Uncharacterized protein n=1 Tax=Tilletiopsis washingtonensis TaxID=58919 RepID=A0A316ZDK4_9BASI|nr:hypothetical protein FA09DRAFT_218821 [Tilletiopsis washingtonensis]PWN99790.1 hypothetical protein FA09DRAFT_218821 [Tilletiopsis washingtonensis]
MPHASDDYLSRGGGSGSGLGSSPHSRIPVRPPLRRMPASRPSAAPDCAFTSPVAPHRSARMVSSPAYSPLPAPSSERAVLSPRTPTASRMPRSPRLTTTPAARLESPSSALLVPASPAATFSPLHTSSKSTPLALRRPPGTLRPGPPSPALSAASRDSSRSGRSSRAASPLPQPVAASASGETAPSRVTSRIPATPRASNALRPRDGNVPVRRLSPSAPPLKAAQSPAMVSSASQTTPIRSRLPVSPSRRVPAPLFIPSPEIVQLERPPLVRRPRASAEAAPTPSPEQQPWPARVSADTSASSLQWKALPEEPKEESLAPLLETAQHTDALLRSRRMRTTSEGVPHGGSLRGSATFSPARSGRRLAKLRGLPMFSHTRQASGSASANDSSVPSPTSAVFPEFMSSDGKSSSSVISSFMESMLHHAHSATSRSRKRASHGDDAFLGASPGRRRGAAGRTLSGSHQPFVGSAGSVTKQLISAPMPIAEGVSFAMHPAQVEAKLAAAPQLRGSPSLPELRTVAPVARIATSASATKLDEIDSTARGSPSAGFAADDPRNLWLSNAPHTPSHYVTPAWLSNAPHTRSTWATPARPVARIRSAPEPGDVSAPSTPTSPATSIATAPTLSPAASRRGSASTASLSPVTPARYPRYCPAAALTKQGLSSLEAELEIDSSLTPKLRRPAQFSLSAYRGSPRAPGKGFPLDVASHDGSISFDETCTSISSECPSLIDSEAESLDPASASASRDTSTSLLTATQSPNPEAQVHACILDGISVLSESPEAIGASRKTGGSKYCFEVLNAESASAEASDVIVADAQDARSPALYELSSVEGSDAESDASDDESVRDSVYSLQELLTQASRKLEAHCSPQNRASSLEAAGARAQAARPDVRASIRRSHGRTEGQREVPPSVELPPEGLELRIVDDEHGGPPRLELSWEVRLSGADGHRSVAGRTLVPEAVSASLFASWASSTGLGTSPAKRKPLPRRDEARLTGTSVHSDWSAISSSHPSFGELELQQLQASAQAQLQASREWGLQPARERHLSHPVQESPSLLEPNAWAASSPRSPSFFPRPLLLSRPSNERRRTREESAPAETQSTRVARASQRSGAAGPPVASPNLLDVATSRRSRVSSRQATTPRSTLVPIGTPRSTVPSSPGATLGYLPRLTPVGPSHDASVNANTLLLLQRAAESCADITPRSRRPPLPRSESIESALMDTRPPYQILTASSSLAEITGAGN